ncbi:hypothetical protein V8F20_010995 [Naviculisporaceae sp. PSN 640]
MPAAKRKLPTILPKEAEFSTNISRTVTNLPPKRRATQVVCENCRKRKTKCDGSRPQCTPCVKKALPCVFVTLTKLDSAQAEKLSQTSQTLTDLFNLLKGHPEDAAIEAFWHIRQGRSPEAILASIGGGMSGRTNLSFNMTNRALLPPTQTPLEFQLVVQHPNVYPSLTPLNIAALDLQLLGIPPLSVDVHETRRRSMLSYLQGPAARPDVTVDPKKVHNKEVDRTAIDLVDSRLRYLNIAHWTNIKISNRFAAEAITIYLRMNQTLWAFFHTDLFLDDLVSGETRFCSQMLVNAVLAWASQSYAHYEPTAAALSERFLDEALRIFDIEGSEDRLTTLAATSLMSMTFTALGKDKAGRHLQQESSSMATRLGLYGESDGLPTTGPLDLNDEKVKLAASAAAWGSFNFHMVVSMSWHLEPLPKGLPKLPIPDDIWVAPGSSRPADPSVASTYTCVCRLWSTAFEMNNLYYCENAAPSLSSAEAIFNKFLAWADTLQDGVKRGKHNPDHVLNLQYLVSHHHNGSIPSFHRPTTATKTRNLSLRTRNSSISDRRLHPAAQAPNLPISLRFRVSQVLHNLAKRYALPSQPDPARLLRE